MSPGKSPSPVLIFLVVAFDLLRDALSAIFGLSELNSHGALDLGSTRLMKVLLREGLKSTARPKMTQTVPSKRTANVFYQGTARPRVPQAVLSQSSGRPYYPRMDNIRPRTSKFSPTKRFSTTRTPHRPQRPKKIMKSIWVKKASTVGSQAVLP
ncbi:hypothetical protein Tco_1532346 [Tanacetum coccineum]